MPTEQEVTYAEENRQQAARLIEQFEEGMREDRVEQVVSLISPELPTRNKQQLARMVRDALLLPVYNGYEANARAAVQDTKVRDWLDGTVDVKVPGTNAFGDEIPEKLRLVKSRDLWYIANMNLAQPEPGMVVEPEQEVRREIAKISKKVFELLREETPGELVLMIPRGDRTRYITTDPTFWGYLKGHKPQKVSVVQVVEDVFVPLEITRWPDPLEDMQLVYNGRGRLIALYEVPYHWPDSPAGTDTMEVEVHVYRSQEGWKLDTLRFYGGAFEAMDIRRE
jgi:hypothetical protein